MDQSIRHQLYRLCLFFSFLSTSTLTYADYIVVGDIKGQVCSGFIVDVCSMKKIDAVGDGSGALYTPSDHFESVTDYRERDDRCWIRIKGEGLIGKALSLFSSTQFYSMENGQYEEVDPEYLTFKCLKL